MRSILLIFTFLLCHILSAQNLSIKQVDTPPRLVEACMDVNTEECFTRSLSIYVNRNLDFYKLGKNKASGTAYVQFTINSDGTISEVRSRSKSKVLGEVAEESLRKLKIAEPAKKDGKPVSMTYTLPVTFRSIKIGGGKSNFEDRGDRHEVPSVTKAARAPEFEDYTKGLDDITSQFKKDVREKLINMNFQEKEIRELKISFHIDRLRNVKNLVVITPNKHLRKVGKKLIEELKITRPALNENGQPIEVRLSYNFQFD